MRKRKIKDERRDLQMEQERTKKKKIKDEVIDLRLEISNLYISNLYLIYMLKLSAGQ